MAGALTCQRDAFGLPDDLHYLNCAYMGPLPLAAEEAGIRGIRKKLVPISIAPRDFYDESDRLRRLFADLVNAEDPKRVALVPGVSYGVAVAARNLPVEAGQNVVLTHEQFPGNVYAWRRLAGENGAEVRFVAPPGAESGDEAGREGRGEAWNRRLL